METKDPFIEFIKALARRQARLDALPKQPANENLPKDDQARKQ